MPDINLVEERRHMVLNDIAATVGSVFLGLQMGCAECHDHKYDPLSQADFYRLRAFFEPALSFDKHKFGRVLHEKQSDKRVQLAAFVYERGDFRRRGPRVEPAYPRIAVDGNAATCAVRWRRRVAPPRARKLARQRRQLSGPRVSSSTASGSTISAAAWCSRPATLA